jgi:hypothetical protein
MNTVVSFLTTSAFFLLAMCNAWAFDVNVRDQAGMWGLSMDGVEGTPVFSVPLGAPGGSPIPSTQLVYNPNMVSQTLDVSLAGGFGAPQGSLGRSFSDNVLQPLALGPVQEVLDIGKSMSLGFETTSQLSSGSITPPQALSQYGQAAWTLLPGTGIINFGVDVASSAIQTVNASTAGITAPEPQPTSTTFTYPDGSQARLGNTFETSFGW